jgi:primosomal protein N' (replication factor Y)
VLRKGADRTTEEIGKIFPKVPIHLSTGTKRIDSLKREKTNSIIIATPGAEPEADYGAVVLLDGEIQFNRTQLRADEVARLRWRKNIWQVIEGGYIYSSLPNSHQFIQDIYINNEQRYFSREISNRKIAKLPPSYGIAKITGATRDLLTFAANLREGKANLEVLVSDVREVEASTGTTPLESTVIIRFQKKFQPNVVSLLNEVNQVRMLKKKTAFSIMIDGYDLI